MVDNNRENRNGNGDSKKNSGNKRIDEGVGTAPDPDFDPLKSDKETSGNNNSSNDGDS